VDASRAAKRAGGGRFMFGTGPEAGLPAVPPAVS
jgi:hypothetical protein